MKFEKNPWSFIYIYALLKAKISLPNLDIYQFSYSERLIHSKSYPITYGVWRKSLEAFFIEKPLPKLKLAFHQFFCNKRLLHAKRFLKGNFCMVFEENYSSCLNETRTLSKAKIWLPNLDFHQFSCRKRLILSKNT